MSPLFFCLDEEVLSRSLSYLVTKHKILPMTGSKGKDFPTHVLYANDIFVFCRVNKKPLSNLMAFSQVYGSISGQWMNASKVFSSIWIIPLLLIAGLEVF